MNFRFPTSGKNQDTTLCFFLGRPLSHAANLMILPGFSFVLCMRSERVRVHFRLLKNLLSIFVGPTITMCKQMFLLIIKSMDRFEIQ